MERKGRILEISSYVGSYRRPTVATCVAAVVPMFPIGVLFDFSAFSVYAVKVVYGRRACARLEGHS